MTEENIKRATLAEIRAMKDRGELYYDPNAPEGPDLPDSFWENAIWVDPDGKTSVQLKVDADVVFYLKRQGKDHIIQMQDFLREYVKTQKAKEAAASPSEENYTRKAG